VNIRRKNNKKRGKLYQGERETKGKRRGEERAK